MAFKRQHEADLLAWDRFAPVTVAQVMIMGGALRPDFDTREFDRRIGRRPGARATNANAMRVMVAALPKLRITVVDTMPMAKFLDPAQFRAVLIARGMRPHLADRHVGSKRYEQARSYGTDFAAVGATMGQRFGEMVTPHPRHQIEQMVNRGAVALTVAADEGGLVMLLASVRSPDKVRAYFPQAGTHLSTLDELHRQGVIDLDTYGATVHAM